MKTIIILSDQDAKSHAKELEQLIKIIGWTGIIKHLDYDEYFPLDKDDKLFAVCPSKPVTNFLHVPAPTTNTDQIIPVTYLDSKKKNLPSGLQCIASLVISGHYFPSFAVDNLYRILDIPNPLNIKYTHRILRNNSLQKSIKSTLLATLSSVEIARRTRNTTARQYIQTIQHATLETAEKLKNILVLLPESEQREITHILIDTPLGNYLGEKISLEKNQEAAAIATTRFRC